MDNEKFYIYGRNVVIEALKACKPIEKIYFLYGSKGESISTIYSLAKKKKINCITYDKRKFQNLEESVGSVSNKSQGVIALLEIIENHTIEELIALSFAKEKEPVLVALDGINDPQNLGAIARTALCSGAAGFILTERDSSPVTPAAVKASSGALEHIPIAKTLNLINAIQKLKDNGFWIIGTDANSSELYTKEIYNGPLLIIIGSEGTGMHQSIKKHCDYLVRIPIKGDFSSLNASVSAGIILFEISRQRGL